MAYTEYYRTHYFYGLQQTLGGLEPPASLSTGLDEDILTVAAGKDFTLVRTVGGKVSEKNVDVCAHNFL